MSFYFPRTRGHRPAGQPGAERGEARARRPCAQPGGAGPGAVPKEPPRGQVQPGPGLAPATDAAVVLFVSSMLVNCTTRA